MRQGGEDWVAGRREQILGLGAAGINAGLRVREGTRLERARAALALTAVPASLPCRERERADILQFVEDAVTGAPLHVATWGLGSVSGHDPPKVQL